MIDRSALDRWLLRNPMPSSFPSKEAKKEYFGSMPEVVEREWGIRQAKDDLNQVGYNAKTAERARKRMARVDSMSPEWRRLVYDYGLELVQEFINHRVTAHSARHLIMACMNERPDGSNFFRPNVTVNAKRNPAADEDEYWSIPGR